MSSHSVDFFDSVEGEVSLFRSMMRTHKIARAAAGADTPASQFSPSYDSLQITCSPWRQSDLRAAAPTPPDAKQEPSALLGTTCLSPDFLRDSAEDI